MRLAAGAQRDPHQPEFPQAVREVMTRLRLFITANPQFGEWALLEGLVQGQRSDGEGMRFCQGSMPDQASHTGGVVVSGLEMSQNVPRTSWTAGEVDE